MFIWGWTPDYADPSKILNVLTTDQSEKRSDCYWANDEYDELYELQKIQVKEDERTKTEHRLKQIKYEKSGYNVAIVRE